MPRRPHRTDDYPFRPEVLSDADLRAVERELSRADAEYRLLKDHPGLLELVLVFLKNCSPRAPNLDALLAMGLYLYVITYLGDRVSSLSLAQDARDAFRLLMCTADACLEPSSRSSGEHDLRGAALETGRRIRAIAALSDGNMSTVSHRLEVNLSAFVWRRDHPGSANSLDEHLELRTQDVSVLAYERLWGLLTGLVDGLDMRFALALERLERLSAKVCALANEIRSVERDDEQGVANAVLIVETECRLDRSRALSAVGDLHDAALHLLAAELERTRLEADAACEPRLAAYVEFIGTCTRGNSAAMDELFLRYR